MQYSLASIINLPGLTCGYSPTNTTGYIYLTLLWSTQVWIPSAIKWSWASADIQSFYVMILGTIWPFCLSSGHSERIRYPSTIRSKFVVSIIWGWFHAHSCKQLQDFLCIYLSLLKSFLGGIWWVKAYWPVPTFNELSSSDTPSYHLDGHPKSWS